MSVIQGTDGYFVAGVAGSGVTVGELNHWTITKTANAIDVSTFGTRWKKNKNGAVSWTASVSGFCDFSDTGQGAIEDSLDDGTVIELYAHLSGDKYYYGKGYVTNVSVDDTHDGVVTFSADITGTDELYNTRT